MVDSEDDRLLGVVNTEILAARVCQTLGRTEQVKQNARSAKISLREVLNSYALAGQRVWDGKEVGIVDATNFAFGDEKDSIRLPFADAHTTNRMQLGDYMSTSKQPITLQEFMAIVNHKKIGQNMDCCYHLDCKRPGHDEVLLCDGCARAFHQECEDLTLAESEADTVFCNPCKQAASTMHHGQILHTDTRMCLVLPPHVVQAVKASGTAEQAHDLVMRFKGRGEPRAPTRLLLCKDAVLQPPAAASSVSGHADTWTLTFSDVSCNVVETPKRSKGGRASRASGAAASAPPTSHSSLLAELAADVALINPLTWELVQAGLGKPFLTCVVTSPEPPFLVHGPVVAQTPDERLRSIQLPSPWFKHTFANSSPASASASTSASPYSVPTSITVVVRKAGAQPKAFPSIPITANFGISPAAAAAGATASSSNSKEEVQTTWSITHPGVLKAVSKHLPLGAVWLPHFSHAGANVLDLHVHMFEPMMPEEQRALADAVNPFREHSSVTVGAASPAAATGPSTAIPPSATPAAPPHAAAPAQAANDVPSAATSQPSADQTAAATTNGHTSPAHNWGQRRSRGPSHGVPLQGAGHPGPSGVASAANPGAGPSQTAPAAGGIETAPSLSFKDDIVLSKQEDEALSALVADIVSGAAATSVQPLSPPPTVPPAGAKAAGGAKGPKAVGGSKSASAKAAAAKRRASQPAPASNRAGASPALAAAGQLLSGPRQVSALATSTLSDADKPDGIAAHAGGSGDAAAANALPGAANMVLSPKEELPGPSAGAADADVHMKDAGSEAEATAIPDTSTAGKRKRAAVAELAKATVPPTVVQTLSSAATALAAAAGGSVAALQAGRKPGAAKKQKVADKAPASDGAAAASDKATAAAPGASDSVPLPPLSAVPASLAAGVARKGTSSCNSQGSRDVSQLRNVHRGLVGVAPDVAAEADRAAQHAVGQKPASGTGSAAAATAAATSAAQMLTSLSSIQPGKAPIATSSAGAHVAHTSRLAAVNILPAVGEPWGGWGPVPTADTMPGVPRSSMDPAAAAVPRPPAGMLYKSTGAAQAAAAAKQNSTPTQPSTATADLKQQKAAAGGGGISAIAAPSPAAKDSPSVKARGRVPIPSAKAAAATAGGAASSPVKQPSKTAVPSAAAAATPKQTVGQAEAAPSQELPVSGRGTSPRVLPPLLTLQTAQPDPRRDFPGLPTITVSHSLPPAAVGSSSAATDSAAAVARSTSHLLLTQLFAVFGEAMLLFRSQLTREQMVRRLWPLLDTFLAVLDSDAWSSQMPEPLQLAIQRIYFKLQKWCRTPAESGAMELVDELGQLVMQQRTALLAE